MDPKGRGIPQPFLAVLLLGLGSSVLRQYETEGIPKLVKIDLGHVHRRGKSQPSHNALETATQTCLLPSLQVHVINELVFILSQHEAFWA